MSQFDIRIGTLASAPSAVTYLPQIIPHGFESFGLTFWQNTGDTDLKKLAAGVKKVLDKTPAKKRPVISSLGIFGNPLEDARNEKNWADCIDHAHAFGCDLVVGFAGCITGKPIHESYKRFGEVFRPLAKRAADKGVRLAFENCDMGGWWHSAQWNMAHSPTAWEAMFNEVPGDNVGLEWEPCHQMVSLIDPLPQLRQWVKKVFHVHGKDATVMWDVVRTKGIRGGVPYVYHRTPGFGDTNWTDVITILRLAGYKGSIDIEGWHDPVYRGELEMTGQVHGLKYLQNCRGGEFVPNPK